jgi:hypothetical protein
MRNYLYAAIAVSAFMSSPAGAQMAPYPATTPMPPPPSAPPAGTLSVTRDSHTVDAYGNRTDSQSTTYRDSQGVAQDRSTTTTTVAPPPPPPPPVITTTTTTRTTTEAPN